MQRSDPRQEYSTTGFGRRKWVQRATRAYAFPRLAFALVLLFASAFGVAAELPHHHLGFIVGHAEEENAEGEFQRGSVLGLEYVHKFHDRWALGAVFEQETFGNNQKRHGILAVPVSFYVSKHWRLFAAAGMEFSDPWKPDKAMGRLGTGYEFPIGKRGWTLAPEVQIDFVEGGTNVYVFALVLGYGWH